MTSGLTNVGPDFDPKAATYSISKTMLNVLVRPLVLVWAGVSLGQRR